MFIRNTLLALALVMTAAPASALVEGTDYRSITPPQPTSSPPGKIEVIEFFSYGCPHCNEFYPLLNAWVAKQSKDVDFKRLAIGLGRTAWTNLAKMYFALESTGDLARLDAQIFHDIHEGHQPLFDEKAITDWVGKHGVNTAKFAAAFESFGVNTKLNQAEQKSDNDKLEGVPSIVIDGKYSILGNSFEEMLVNASAVLTKVRADRGTR